MFKKTKIRQILNLLHVNSPNAVIAEILHVSRNTAAKIDKKLISLNLSYEELMKMSDDELYQIFFPDKFQRKSRLASIDYSYVQSELKRTGVTLHLLWEEYVDDCKEKGLIPCSYPTFTLKFKDYKSKSSYTSHLNHRPGETMEVDYSGPSMYFIDKDKNKKIKAYLFVACMPYSQKVFVKATTSMEQDSWIQLNVDMLNYYGGIPVKIVCDNLKTGVLSHPKNGPIELNPEYLAFADYYNVAIIPTGVRKPKEKASVEGSVGKIATKVIAKLRNETFYSLDGLNKAIFKAVEDFNNEEFQKRKGSRNLIFNVEEKGYLRPLPSFPYEVCSWTYSIKVMNNSHVTYKHNFYSVPYKYLGKTVDLKVSKNRLFIYYKRNLICEHQLLDETIKNEYVTDKTHLDPHKEYTPYTYEDLIKIAKDIGENTLKLVNRIFNEYKTKEQGFNDVKLVLNLRIIYSSELIEKASKLALETYSYPHYKQVLEMINKEENNIENNKNENKQSKYLRGASYYKKGESK